MGMNVDEARQHHLAARVEHLGRSEAAFDLVASTDREDLAVFDDDRAVGDHPSGGVHGDDEGAGDDEISHGRPSAVAAASSTASDPSA